MVGDAQEQARMRIYDGKFEIHVRRTPATRQVVASYGLHNGFKLY